MPTELIFTSAPEGIKPGSSGYCTVARHEEMDPFLERALEGISFYEMDGALRPFIHAFRILPLQTGNFYVLSRICYAGSDHTGRFNYLAHHLAFSESEILAESLPSPADYLLESDRWLDRWPSGKRPTLFSQGEGATPLFLETPLPAQGSDWERITGDARNAAEVFYRRDWRILTASGDHYVPLSLLSESCASAAVDVSWKWQTLTFTTFLQPSDSPENFFVTCGNSGSAVEKLNRDTLYLDKDSESCFQAVGASAPARLVPTQPKQQETTPPEEASPEVLPEQVTAPPVVSKPVQSAVPTPTQAANEPTEAQEYVQHQYAIAPPPDPVLPSEWTTRKILTVSGASLAGVIILVVSLIFLFSDDDSKETSSPNQGSVEDQAPVKNDGADAVVQDGGETQPVRPEANQSKPSEIAGSTPGDSQPTKKPPPDNSSLSTDEKPSLPDFIDLEPVAGQEQIPTEFHFVDKLKPLEDEGFDIRQAYEPKNNNWDWQDSNGSVDALAYRLEKKPESNPFDIKPDQIRYVFIKGSFPIVEISGFLSRGFEPKLDKSDSMKAYENAKITFLSSINELKKIGEKYYNSILQAQKENRALGEIVIQISKGNPKWEPPFNENFPQAQIDLETNSIRTYTKALEDNKKEITEIESLKNARNELKKIGTLKTLEWTNKKKPKSHEFYISAVRLLGKDSGFKDDNPISVAGKSNDILDCIKNAKNDFKKDGKVYKKDATGLTKLSDAKSKALNKPNKEIPLSEKIKICKDELCSKVKGLNSKLIQIEEKFKIDLNDAFDRPKTKEQVVGINNSISHYERLIEALNKIKANLTSLEKALKDAKEPTEVREGERVLLRIK